MSWRSLGRIMAVGAWVAGCGPDVVAPPGDTDPAATEGATVGSDGADGPLEGSSSGSDEGGDSTGDDGSTGDTGEPPPETALCWSSILARARGVERAWTDGERIVAAAQDSVLVFDGRAFQEIATDERVRQVAADAWDDAWVLGDASLFHWDGRALTSSMNVEGSTMRAVAMAPSGAPWVAYTIPGEDCLGLCEEPPTEVVEHVGVATNLLPAPGILVRAMVFADDVPFLGGTGGDVVHRPTDGPWQPVETPFSDDVERMWWASGAVWVAAGDELWRYEDEAWTLAFATAGLFGEVTAVVEGPSGEALILQTTHVVGELDDTGEVMRETGGGWESLATVAADRELLVRADGSLAVLGDEHGQLVQTIADPFGTAEVETVYFRPDLGEIGALSVTGDGTLVGVDPDAVAVEEGGAWTRTHDNSIYGWLRAAWGETADDLVVVESDDDTPHALLRFADGAFTPMPFVDPGPEPDAYFLADIWGTAANRMFVAGWRDPYWLLEPDAPIVFAFDGQAWTEIEAPPHSDNVHLHLNEVEGDGEEVWAAGNLVWRFDGDAWTDVTPDTEAAGFGALTVGPHGAWVVEDDGLGAARLLHWSDGAWIDETDEVPGYESVMGGYPGMLVADDATDVWVAWGSESPGLARWDGEGWSAVELPEAWAQLKGMIVAPNGRLVVHAGARLWSGEACER
jgi:hypothetical protein